jgi:hypothetical protein
LVVGETRGTGRMQDEKGSTRLDRRVSLQSAWWTDRRVTSDSTRSKCIFIPVPVFIPYIPYRFRYVVEPADPAKPKSEGARWFLLCKSQSKVNYYMDNSSVWKSLLEIDERGQGTETMNSRTTASCGPPNE